ncbi:helix-turn-helix domain-containing protein [Streptomonospora nanhaiensis]|uniref:helix-turn-helix domain-containing protein n=1 Tax=Streptomonospora nanhaiensis TaxID=1323731 RepID=UPI001C38F7C8|nr:PucR family transcriptional regulator [Streptomonospora nanhaiensis]MBV2365822.1 PucR family transcriptional regulator [Streptomonospora nanhaiensis]
MDHPADEHAPPAADASGADRPRPADAPARGITVAEALGLPGLRGTEILAGAAGLGRVVRRLAVAATAEEMAGAGAGELLLAAAPLRGGGRGGAVRLLRDLDDRGLAAVAVGPGAAAVPREALRTADNIALPVLRLGAEVPLGEVPARLLGDVLDRRAACLERAERVRRALAEADRAGGGPAALAAALAGPLGGGVLVTTPEGRVLARAGVSGGAAADPALFDDGGARFRTADFPLGPAEFEEAASEAAGAAGPAAAPRAVQVPVVSGGVDHGRVVLLPHGRAAAPEDVGLLERAAATAALSLARGLAEAAMAEKYRGDLLRDLLAGRADDPGDPGGTARRCAALGWDVDRPLVVVVAEFPPEAGADGGARPDHERAAAWAAAARERDPGAAVAGYRREVVVLTRADGPGRGGGAGGAAKGAGRRGASASAARDLVARMAGEPGGPGGAPAFTAGISRAAQGPRELPRAYEQARRAARVARSTRGPGAVAEFDELGVDRLLSLVGDGAELRAFAAETLGELAETGSPEADDLRATLEALLDNNLNVAETARALHFHYNTLRYRIGKLERMLGPFSTDPQLRLDLLVALRVLRMRDPG